MADTSVNSDTPVMVTTSGRAFITPFGAFCHNNGDSIDHRLRLLIAMTLTRGETYSGGGGAEPCWQIRCAQ